MFGSFFYFYRYKITPILMHTWPTALRYQFLRDPEFFGAFFWHLKKRSIAVLRNAFFQLLAHKGKKKKKKKMKTYKKTSFHFFVAEKNDLSYCCCSDLQFQWGHCGIQIIQLKLNFIHLTFIWHWQWHILEPLSV